MANQSSGNFNVDELLSNLFPMETLSELFRKRIEELDLTPTTALEILNIEYRALNGILDGTSKRVDNTTFIKLANFLKISKEKVFSLYLNELEKNYPQADAYPKEKIEFIQNNFDLAALRKVNFIDNLADYQQIEEKIKHLLGLEDIFDYKLPSNHIAFSAGKVQPKNIYTRGLWINAAQKFFIEIDNPNEYNKEALLAYFPKIRQCTEDVFNGLIKVIKELYKLGITVIYQPPLPSLHLRGATLNSGGKRCIVLTDYYGFYSTIWFALVHELFHVIFDFDEIQTNRYHLSDEDSEGLKVDDKENEANIFARNFLFSMEKMEKIRPHINNSSFVEDVASMNNVHPSIIYTLYAFDEGSGNKLGWSRAKKKNPDFRKFVEAVENPWDKPSAVRAHAKLLKETIYENNG